jgi:uncharacterized protein YqeY
MTRFSSVFHGLLNHLCGGSVNYQVRSRPCIVATLNIQGVSWCAEFTTSILVIRSQMMSETRQRVLDDIKTAMKARDKPRLATLRLMSAAIKQKEVDERIELDEATTLAIFDKLLKQRRESISQFQTAGRDDLVAQEEAESEIIQTYMPAALGDGEIAAIIDAAITETGAASVKDMGKVMGLVKPKLQGRADMSSVSKTIRDRLNT